MAKLTRFGTAVSAIALAGFVAGCAAPFAKSGSAKSNVTNPKVGLALRAQAALGSGDLVSAVSLAEQAVANSPQSAEVRSLLGNAYFASGRFASAETAYRDSLALQAAQPPVVLKLALVQIAQGKNAAAIALLESARGMIEPADHGLALALAGQPGEAIALLEPAARSVGADSRVRQNLALAHGLSGDWDSARTIASQDLPADILDSRIQQWMALAKPARSSDQVATLVGVVPAAADAGQPVELALNAPAAQIAEAAPAPAPALVEAPAPQPELAAVELPPIPAPAYESAPVETAAVQAPAPVVVPAAAPAPAFEPAPAPRKALARAKARAAALGTSSAVVQLGAYRSPERVALAWNQLSQRYPALKSYSPVRARFDGPQGPVWRLAIKGFGNQQEAISRCNQLRSRGASCFVRSAAGDAPVQFASR